LVGAKPPKEGEEMDMSAMSRPDIKNSIPCQKKGSFPIYREKLLATGNTIKFSKQFQLFFCCTSNH